jgi:hypothetical protein
MTDTSKRMKPSSDLTFTQAVELGQLYRRRAAAAFEAVRVVRSRSSHRSQ